MEFKKCVIKKEVVLEDSFPQEVIDVRMQLIIEPGDRMEDARAELHQRFDQRFNRLFHSEYLSMKERIVEAEEWKQLGLFSDHLDISANDIMRSDDDDDI